MRASLALLLLASVGCGSISFPTDFGRSVPNSSIEDIAANSTAKVPFTQDPIGTPQPIVVQSVSPDGRWVAACQARKDTNGDGRIQLNVGMHGGLYGDDVALYLFLDESEMKIDEWIGSDGTGRYVAFLRDGSLILLDTHSGEEIDLSARGAPILSDHNHAMGHRSAAFDELGRYMLYISGPPDREHLRVRELASGTEWTLPHGVGRLWRAHFLGDGSWLHVAVVVEDTDGNGRLDLPRQRTSLARGICLGPPASYGVYGFEGDAFETRVRRTQDGIEPSGEVVASGGDALVIQASDRSIRWRTPSSEHTVVPAECDGFVIAVWPKTESLLIVCAGRGDPFQLSVFDRRGEHLLGVEVPPPPEQSKGGGALSDRIIPVEDRRFVDLETALLHERAYGGIQARRGSRLLETVKGGNLRIRDLATGEITELAGPTEHGSWGEQYGRWAAIQREDHVLIIDVDAGLIVGCLTDMPIVIREDGALLIPTSVDNRIPQGPLHWTHPTKRDCPVDRASSEEEK